MTTLATKLTPDITYVSEAPVSGIREIPAVRPIAASLAELHAAAYEGDLVALARASSRIEATLFVPELRTVVAVSSRPSLEKIGEPIDVSTGLWELLGDRETLVTPVVEVACASREEEAREAVVEAGRAFPLIGGEPPQTARIEVFGERVEIVVGEKVASVQGVVIAVPPGAPPASTRVVVSSGGHLTVARAPEETIAWLDAIASGDARKEASRAIALSLLLLRRSLENEALPVQTTALVAQALADLDANVRNALAAKCGFVDDAAARMVTCGLSALAIGDHVTDKPSDLRTIAIASMLQPLLDRIRGIDVLEQKLADVAIDDPTMGAEIVVAHETARMRRGSKLGSASIHARLAAMACDEVRPSLSELVDTPRPSVEIPSGVAAQGKTSLQYTPLHRVLAVAHARRLSGTLVAREPSGARHWMVLAGGTPVRVRTKLAASNTDEQSAHLARIGAIASLPLETQIEFFADHDLLVGIESLVPCAPHAAILAATRAESVRDALRDLVVGLGDTKRLRLSPSQLAAYAPTGDEAFVAARVLFDGEALAALGGELETVVPLLAAAHLVGELRVE
jgi:hypothetical protein